ncbi:MAG: DUF3309 family protein [Burkholderiales bacterium]
MLVSVVLLLVGAAPAWPYRGEWGSGPSGGLALDLIVLQVLLLMRQI